MSQRRPNLAQGTQLRSVLAESDDVTLAHALANGNTAAIRVAMERFGPLVRRIVQRTPLARLHDAEDLQQDVFVSLFQSASTLRDHNALRAYIISTTVFKIRRALRSRKVRLSASPGDVPAIIGRSWVNPNPEATQTLRSLCSMLERMGGEDRTIFVLRFVDGRPLGEVASAIGMSLATLKRRMARLRRRLAALFSHDPCLEECLAYRLGRSKGAIGTG